MGKMTREQVEASLHRGEHVAVAGRTLQPGRSPRETRATLESAFPQLEAVTDEQGNVVREAGGTQAMRAGAREVDAVVLRGANGKLTRAGMEHVLRSGGGVMLNGEVIDHLEDLPDAVTLAQGDEKRLQAHLDGLREDRARLDLEGRRASDALENARRTREQGEQAARARATEGQSAVGSRQGQQSETPPTAEPAGQSQQPQTQDDGGHVHGTPAQAEEPREPQPPEEQESHQQRRGRHR